MANRGVARCGSDLMLRLTPGTSITFIDDQPVIASQARRALFEVNQIGGYIGCRLEEGVGLRQLAAEVADRGFVPALTMLREVLAKWSHYGLVCATETPPVSDPLVTQPVALGGARFLLRYHDPVLAGNVASLFAHLPGSSGPPEIRYDLWSSHGLPLLSRDGGEAAVLDARQAAAVVKARIIQDVINDTRWELALHTGCLHRNGHALLVTGRPGAGKTTLTSWALDAGFAYGGDDITMLRSDGRVQGLPFLPTVKSGAWPLMASKYPDSLGAEVHWRPDGKRVRYLAPMELAGEAPVPVGWIVKLRRKKDGVARLAPLSAVPLVTHLLAEAASASGQVERPALDMLIHMVRGARTCELHYADLDEAVSLLEGLCDGTA